MTPCSPDDNVCLFRTPIPAPSEFRCHPVGILLSAVLWHLGQKTHISTLHIPPTPTRTTLSPPLKQKPILYRPGPNFTWTRPLMDSCSSFRPVPEIFFTYQNFSVLASKKHFSCPLKVFLSGPFLSLTKCCYPVAVSFVSSRSSPLPLISRVEPLPLPISAFHLSTKMHRELSDAPIPTELFRIRFWFL